MNLGEQLNQLADEVELRPLASAGEIRRTGDRRRRRRRGRLAAGTAVAALVAALLAAALTRPRTPPPEPIGPIDGWKVTGVVQVPGSGVMFYGDRSLWVVDNAGQRADEHGVPSGDLYQVDPDSDAVLNRLPHAVGGWPSVAAGALWLSTPSLEALTRVDVRSHQIRHVATSGPARHPIGTAVAGRYLWVIQGDTGDLLRLNATDGRQRQRIHLGDVDQGTAPRSIVSDGRDVWAANDNGLLTRLDGATGEIVSRLQLPLRQPLFDAFDTKRDILYAHELRNNSLIEINLDQGGGIWRGRELTVTRSTDGMVAGTALTGNSLWVATLNPDELLRIDRQTLAVSGRTPLPRLNHESNVPLAMTAAGQQLWIRVAGKVLKLEPSP